MVLAATTYELLDLSLSAVTQKRLVYVRANMYGTGERQGRK